MAIKKEVDDYACFTVKKKKRKERERVRERERKRRRKKKRKKKVRYVCLLSLGFSQTYDYFLFHLCCYIFVASILG